MIEERKERIKAEKESEAIVAAADSRMQAQKAAADNDILLQQKKALMEIESIENDMVVARAAAQARRGEFEAQALEALFRIKGYSEVRIAEAVSANQKIYYGEKIPSYIVSSGGDLAQATK